MLSIVIVIVLGVAAGAQDEGSETKVKLQDLPPAVQQAVKEHGQGASLRGFSKEVKAGRTLYEAEMRVKGRTRDVTFDADGKVVSVEEETTLAEIPAAAREAIQAAAAGGTLTLVEKIVEGTTTSYELHFTIKGKEAELKVDASGKRVD